MKALTYVRHMLLAVLVFGLTGTLTELLLIEHYEDAWQFAPLLLIPFAFGGLVWHGVRPGAGSARVLQGMMGIFVIAGVVGMALHFRGAAEFQWEIDPSQPRWDVFTKAMRAKAPPVLAPGVMIQLGLIGLVYLYRSKE